MKVWGSYHLTRVHFYRPTAEKEVLLVCVPLKAAKMSNDWSNGLCSCFEDCTTCIITYFCPCYIFGKNAEQLGESCVMYALSQFVPLLNLWCRTQVRGKIREQKGIEGTCIKDLLMVWCCPLCSLVQEARELKAPGSQSMSRE